MGKAVDGENILIIFMIGIFPEGWGEEREESLLEGIENIPGKSWNIERVDVRSRKSTRMHLDI
jgi:hypothetical protein